MSKNKENEIQEENINQDNILTVDDILKGRESNSDDPNENQYMPSFLKKKIDFSGEKEESNKDIFMPKRRTFRRNPSGASQVAADMKATKEKLVEEIENPNSETIEKQVAEVVGKPAETKEKDGVLVLDISKEIEKDVSEFQNKSTSTFDKLDKELKIEKDTEQNEIKVDIAEELDSKVEEQLVGSAEEPVEEAREDRETEEPVEENKAEKPVEPKLEEPVEPKAEEQEKSEPDDAASSLEKEVSKALEESQEEKPKRKPTMEEIMANAPTDEKVEAEKKAKKGKKNKKDKADEEKLEKPKKEKTKKNFDLSSFLKRNWIWVLGIVIAGVIILFISMSGDDASSSYQSQVTIPQASQEMIDELDSDSEERESEAEDNQEVVDEHKAEMDSEAEYYEENAKNLEEQATSDTDSSDSSSSTYTFRTEEMLQDHFNQHGAEMGFESAEAYEQAAAAVIINPEAIHKTQTDGNEAYYVRSTNEFVVLTTDGYIRTYFKPNEGEQYYDKQ